MKVITRNYGVRMSTEERQVARSNAKDSVLTRGTSRVPSPPRELICQGSSRGILLTWALPAGFSDDIQRWRVYKDDENTLYHEISDRGTRQVLVDATSGTTPPTVNLFVSSMNALGVESVKVQTQGKATAETGAPAIPGVPPGYNQGSGSDKNSNYVGNPGRSAVNNR